MPQAIQELDFILNGEVHGDVGQALMQSKFDPNYLRPWWTDDDRRQYVTVCNGRTKCKDRKPIYKNVPVTNANTTLRKDEWITIDESIIRAARPRFRLAADLRASGLVYNLPNGMGHTVLQYQRMTDITGATLSMDPEREGEADRPEFDFQNLPLPITHKDFHFSLRQIAVSRNGGQPLDTTMAELSAEQCAETIEKLVAGTYGTYTYGGGTVYGYTNHPQRLTKVLTNPTAVGWIGNTLLQEIIAMKAQSKAANYRGPWRIYVSPNWEGALDSDFSAAKGSNTLRERILQVDGINSIDTADFLEGYTILLVQQTSSVVRLVVGMEMTTIQWESKGGMRRHFKVMALMVPQIRADINGQTGIVHGTAP